MEAEPTSTGAGLHILVMEDDDNDVLLLKRAFKKLQIECPLHRVKDGEEGIAYLRGEGRFANRSEFPYPGVVLLDLKMPKKNGFDVLKWMKENPHCKVTPVIILSSSAQDDDVKRAYELGAGGYFLKPHDFTDLLELLTLLRRYWCRARRSATPTC